LAICACFAAALVPTIAGRRIARRRRLKIQTKFKGDEMNRDLFSIGVPFLAGGIVFLLLCFGTGIVTASSTSRMNVAMARVDERATMCFDAATAHILTSGGQVGGPASSALAEQFFTTSGDKRTDTLVQEQCRKKLGA
jgi:hypothetical protein